MDLWTCCVSSFGDQSLYDKQWFRYFDIYLYKTFCPYHDYVAQVMSIAYAFIWRKRVQLKTKLFSVSINAKLSNAMNFVAKVLFDFLSNAIFATAIASKLGILL